MRIHRVECKSHVPYISDNFQPWTSVDTHQQFDGIKVEEKLLDYCANDAINFGSCLTFGERRHR